VWLSDAGNLRVEFDPNAVRFFLMSFRRRLPPTPKRHASPGTKPGSYKYRLWLNDQHIGQARLFCGKNEKEHLAVPRRATL